MDLGAGVRGTRSPFFCERTLKASNSAMEWNMGAPPWGGGGHAVQLDCDRIQLPPLHEWTRSEHQILASLQVSQGILPLPRWRAGRYGQGIPQVLLLGTFRGNCGLRSAHQV